MSSAEGFNTIVVGGGQSGLAAGYYLNHKGDNFIILDENARIGETWRNRWDSLRLFTPSQNDHLPGMKFPKPDFYFPTKDEAADYLEAYANQFKLPVQYGLRVDSLQRNDNGFKLTSGNSDYHTRNVIVATGAFRTPYTPAIAKELDPGIFQMHSADYRKPTDLSGKNILVVGAGNSGSEIALELAKASKKVWLAGRDVGRIPADSLGKILGGKPYWWFMRNVMTIRTPIGRRMKSIIFNQGDPLIRARRQELAEAGVEFTPRLMGSVEGKPQLESGRVLPAEGVIWATGYRPNYGWINLSAFEASGLPHHQRGVVPEIPGLYFLGLRFQTGLTSSLMGGVGDDAKFITSQISG
jgi:putative flavoprotein involved in K+ transport